MKVIVGANVAALERDLTSPGVVRAGYDEDIGIRCGALDRDDGLGRAPGFVAGRDGVPAHREKERTGQAGEVRGTRSDRGPNLRPDSAGLLDRASAALRGY